MRKFLVKHFVLDYRLFWFNAPRASRIIFPLMILTGCLWDKDLDFFENSIFALISFGLLLISLFFGFVYFRIKPAQWNELDTFQKWQYGRFKELTPEQLKEWIIINKNLL